jgi:cobalt-zinc-cadmium resistance protein CzcA
MMLLQSQDKYTVADQPLPRLEISEDLIAANPEHHYFESQMKQSAARLQTERLSWLPDINLTYFRGTNKYEDSEVYLGWEVGLSVPLIFAGKAGTTKSAAIEKSIAEITYDEHEILVKAHYKGKKE